jgi:hypothetical protein
MTTREYYQIEAANQFPGVLNQADFVDAMANMSEKEWRELNSAYVEYNDMIVGTIIRQSICRQYQKAIDFVAESNYRHHVESERDAELERQAEAKRERAA